MFHLQLDFSQNKTEGFTIYKSIVSYYIFYYYYRGYFEFDSFAQTYVELKVDCTALQ